MPCGLGTNKVNSEPSGFITNSPPSLKIAICSLSGEKVANKSEVFMCVILVGVPPVVGTVHKSEGVLLCAETTVTPISFSIQFGL